MEMRKHPVPLLCPNCSRKATILRLFFVASGDIIVEGLCAPCGKDLELQSSFQFIMAKCVELDVLMPYEDDLRGEDEETQN